LHSHLLSFVGQVQTQALAGHVTAAQILLSEIREPAELGLGYSEGTKDGSAIGPSLRSAIVRTFREVPQLEDTGLDHLEIIALLVPKIAEDRLSDITGSVLKKWLADFTRQRCNDLGIPTHRHRLVGWDADQLNWRPFDVQLPFNPKDDSPILLAPLDLLRRLPPPGTTTARRMSVRRLTSP